jgi:hypothetical protein
MPSSSNKERVLKGIDAIGAGFKLFQQVSGILRGDPEPRLNAVIGRRDSHGSYL